MIKIKYFWTIFLLLKPCLLEVEFKFHSNEEIEQILQDFENNITLTSGQLIAKKYTIGKSHQGYNLSVVSITTKKSDLYTPNLKLIGNIHGNEVVGREVLLQFLFFLRDNYAKNYAVTRLLNNTIIHVMPTMNPDGFNISRRRDCLEEQGRANGNHVKNVDLDVNFPVLFHNQTNKYPQAKETKAVINWMVRESFVLSAVLHGEGLVARYPYDTISKPKWQTFLKKMQFVLDDEEAWNLRQEYIASAEIQPPHVTPDNDVFVHLAKVYSKNHPTMHKGVPDTECTSGYPDGIVNGAELGSTVGGMQDYNYNIQGCMEVTLEISCCNYPDESTLGTYWEDNKMSLLKFSLEANRGIVGTIADAYTHEPIGGASLKIRGRDIIFKSRNNTGLFWRLLLDGDYTLDVSAEGYEPKSRTFRLRQDLKHYPKLQRLDTIYLSNETTTSEPVFSTTIDVSTSQPIDTSSGAPTKDNISIEVTESLKKTTSSGDVNVNINFSLKSFLFYIYITGLPLWLMLL